MKSHQIEVPGVAESEKKFTDLKMTHAVLIHEVKPKQRKAVAEVLLKHTVDTWDEAYELAADRRMMMLGGRDGDGRERALQLITELRAILGVESCSAGPIIEKLDGSSSMVLSCEWPDDEEQLLKGKSAGDAMMEEVDRRLRGAEDAALRSPERGQDPARIVEWWPTEEELKEFPVLLTYYQEGFLEEPFYLEEDLVNDPEARHDELSEAEYRFERYLQEGWKEEE